MSSSATTIGPGATVGILGSGQLGRMLAIAAHRLGYRVAVYSPEPDSPAGVAADREVIGAYDDVDAIARFARSVDVLTFEFENVSAEATAAAARHTDVRPAGTVLHTTQNRLREKRFLADAGLPLPGFAAIASPADFTAALATTGLPAVLKTAGFGYDGKGQQRIDTPEQLETAFADLGGQEAVLEAFVPFERELSVVAARSADGTFVAFPLFANDHVDHILDVTVAPAAVDDHIASAARRIARRVFDGLGIVGVSCVELFLKADQSLLVNEVAPRVHNSGHLTFDCVVTSQFEQHIRAICGLPLGSTAMTCAGAAMANLLGDLWHGGEPNWAALLAVPEAKLHLYGKRDPRPGRKMGHVSAGSDSTAHAAALVREARSRAS